MSESHGLGLLFLILMLIQLFFASFESKDVSHALTDESWINAMHEELEILNATKYGSLLHLLRVIHLSVLNGFSKINKVRMVLLLEIRLDL